MICLDVVDVATIPEIIKSLALRILDTAATLWRALDAAVGADTPRNIVLAAWARLNLVEAKALPRASTKFGWPDESIITAETSDLTALSCIFIGGTPTSSMFDVASAAVGRANAETITRTDATADDLITVEARVATATSAINTVGSGGHLAVCDSRSVVLDTRSDRASFRSNDPRLARTSKFCFGFWNSV